MEIIDIENYLERLTLQEKSFMIELKHERTF